MFSSISESPWTVSAHRLYQCALDGVHRACNVVLLLTHLLQSKRTFLKLASHPLGLAKKLVRPIHVLNKLELSLPKFLALFMKRIQL